MSARAAWRLVSMGFTQVFRYTAGKADWSASGLPTEGQSVDSRRAGNLARGDIETCGLTERADAVRQRLRAKAASICAVVNEQRVLLGHVRAEQVEPNSNYVVEEIMTAGPTTIRPNTPLETVIKFFEAHKPDTVWVTTSDGEVMGLLSREDVERAKRNADGGA